jgi:hypothetical protein
MVLPWVNDELRGVDLKDKRLNERLAEVLSQFAGQPMASIPSACGGWAETAAAYRLFDNEKVDFENVLEPHSAATRRRIAEQATVVLVQDTTEIDLTRPERQVVGAGRLASDARQGAFLHLLTAFTPDGTCLGTLHATTWARREAPPAPAERSARRKHVAIEDKESGRWITALRQARAEAQRAPQTRFVSVADSEADIYELLVAAEAEPQPLTWIVRACQNRAVATSDGGDRLRERLATSPVLFTQTIHVRGRRTKYSGTCPLPGRKQPRDSRTAEVEARAASVTLRPPWRHDRKLPPLAVNVVQVREVAPPVGDAAVEWLLLTNLPVDTPEQVRRVIDDYCVRWMIEVFFRTLKSGCRVEQRRFEHLDRFLPCLAVYLIVTWRTLYVCRLARALPDLGCDAVFEPAEWKAVYQVVRRIAPPSKPPPLSEMVRLVAQLGGYVNRSRTDPPGPQTVWLGLQRVHDLALCWLTFGPEARPPNKDV